MFSYLSVKSNQIQYASVLLQKHYKLWVRKVQLLNISSKTAMSNQNILYTYERMFSYFLTWLLLNFPYTQSFVYDDNTTLTISMCNVVMISTHHILYVKIDIQYTIPNDCCEKTLHKPMLQHKKMLLQMHNFLEQS